MWVSEPESWSTSKNDVSKLYWDLSPGFYSGFLAHDQNRTGIDLFITNGWIRYAPYLIRRYFRDHAGLQLSPTTLSPISASLKNR